MAAPGCLTVQLVGGQRRGRSKTRTLPRVGGRSLNPRARERLTCQRVQVSREAARKKSGAQKARFAYVVSIKKCDFWSMSALAGFGDPGVPEGSTFQWSVPRAAKKFEPFGEMGDNL